MKTCPRCKNPKRLLHFKLLKSGLRDGYCGPCRTAYRRQHKRTPQSRIANRRYKTGPKNRLRLRAWRAVQEAKRTGKLTPIPCEVCGHAEVEAHHGDYSKPLQVEWLCKECHRERHQKAESL